MSGHTVLLCKKSHVAKTKPSGAHSRLVMSCDPSYSEATKLRVFFVKRPITVDALAARSETRWFTHTQAACVNFRLTAALCVGLGARDPFKHPLQESLVGAIITVQASFANCPQRFIKTKEASSGRKACRQNGTLNVDARCLSWQSTTYMLRLRPIVGLHARMHRSW